MATWTHVGGKQSPAEANPFSLTTTTAGDFVLLELCLSGAGVTVTAVSGGNCTWQRIVADTSISAMGGNTSVWLGTVTAAGTANVTVTYSGTPSVIRPNVDEFSCSAGAASVTLDSFTVLNSSAGTATMPTVTPGGAGELMWGYAHDIASSVAGSTPGVVYENDSNGNGTHYALSVSAPLTVVWGDANHNGGITVLLSAGASPVTGTGTAGGKKPAVAGSGTEAFAGSGALGGKKPAAAGSGANGGIAGTGGVTRRKPALAGAGTVTFAGSGQLAGKKAAAAGSGSAAALAVTGSGGITSRKAAAAGAGTEAFAGSGAVTRRKPSAAGAGAEVFAAAGSITSRRPVFAGTGSAGAPPPFTVGVLTSAVNSGTGAASTGAPAGATSTSSSTGSTSTSGPAGSSSTSTGR